MLTDLQSGQRRGDRLEFAADLGRGIRLHVEHVHVTGAAQQVEQNDRLGPRWPWLEACSAILFRSPQQARHCEAEERQSAGAQDLSTIQSVAQRCATTENTKHVHVLLVLEVY